MRELHPLHAAILAGDDKTLKKLLEEDASRVNDSFECNTFDNIRKSPLQFLSDSLVFKKNIYESIFVLVKAGADPLQEHDCDPYYERISPLFTAIKSDNLALARFYLWNIRSDSDYEKTPVTTRLAVDISLALPLSLESYIESRKEPGFAECLKKTGNDAKRARKLEAEAKLFIANGDSASASMAYFQIAQLYAEHAKLEGELSCYHTGGEASTLRGTTPEQYRSLFTEYYQSKRVEFLQLARNNYPNEAIENAYRAAKETLDSYSVGKTGLSALFDCAALSAWINQKSSTKRRSSDTSRLSALTEADGDTNSSDSDESVENPLIPRARAVGSGNANLSYLWRSEARSPKRVTDISGIVSVSSVGITPRAHRG